MASLYRWFSVEKPAYLPDPDAERTEDKASEVREANKAVFVQLIKRDPAHTTITILNFGQR